MKLLSLLILVAFPAFAQDAVIQLPKKNGLNDQVIIGGGYYDTTAPGCFRTYNGTSYSVCPATPADLAVAVAAEATNRAVAIASEAAARLAGDSAVQGGVTVLTSRTSALEVELASVQVGVAAAQTAVNAIAITAASLEVRLAALEVDVAALPKRICATVTLTGLSVPLLGVSSTITAVLTGVPAGAPCSVGLASFTPLGAKPVVVVSPAGSGMLRFEGNSALLSGIINIPNGPARICCDG